MSDTAAYTELFRAVESEQFSETNTLLPLYDAKSIVVKKLYKFPPEAMVLPLKSKDATPTLP